MNNKSLGNLFYFIHNVEKLKIYHWILPQNILPGLKTEKKKKKNPKNIYMKSADVGLEWTEWEKRGPFGGGIGARIGVEVFEDASDGFEKGDGSGL